MLEGSSRVQAVVLTPDAAHSPNIYPRSLVNLPVDAVKSMEESQSAELRPASLPIALHGPS
jgi:hypothetical protein